MADVDLSGRRAGRRWSAIAVTVALFASVLAVDVPAAAAADLGVSTITSTLDSLATWSEDLASVGQLAEQLPGIPASPGSVLGFDDLLAGFLAPLATDTLYSELDHDEDIDLGDGRTGHLTSALSDTGTDDKQLDVTVTVETTVADQQLGIPLSIGADSSAPQSAFSSTGGVSLTVSAQLTFRLVWENLTDTVAIVVDGTTPRIDVDATAEITDLLGMSASIGILGVSVVDKTGDPSELDIAAHFASTVSDPDNDGLLYFVAPAGSSAELAQDGSLAGLVDMGFDTDPGHLNGTFHLTAAAGELVRAVAARGRRHHRGRLARHLRPRTARRHTDGHRFGRDVPQHDATRHRRRHRSAHQRARRYPELGHRQPRPCLRQGQALRRRPDQRDPPRAPR